MPRLQDTMSGAEQSRDLLTEILRHLAAGIAILDTAGSVISWDPEAARITGYTLQEIQEVGFVQLFEPVEVMRHIMHKAQQGILTLHEYLQVKRRDTTRLDVTVQCSPQTALSPGAGRVVVAFRELTPLQENLRRHEHMEMLGRLASALSHELRNPLSAVLLHADLIEEVIRPLVAGRYPEIMETLTDLQTELFRMQELVEDYLSLARLSNLQRQPEDLQSLLTELVRDIQTQLAADHIAVSWAGVETGWYVPCHKGALRRALRNLMQNAIEAMAHSGILTLRGWREGAWVYLAICDTGSGIPEEELPRLFMPFQTTKPGGTGLGLYVVQEIVAAHAGTITVSSTPGQGTTFTVKLPLAMVQEHS